MKPLKGQTAIVTGGSKGYGTGIAQALKQAGATVWITGRDERALRATAKKLGVRHCRADITNGDDWDRLFAAVGRLDILVNNAGAGHHIAPLADQTDAEIAAAIATNLTGAALGCRRAAKVMTRQRSGTILNIASVCARQAWPGWSVYSAAKAGLVQLGQCLHTELRPHGVRVTTVIPSWGATEFGAAAHLPAQDAATRQRSIQPRELGDLVVQLSALPAHLVVQDVTLWPMIQEVVPL